MLADDLVESSKTLLCNGGVFATLRHGDRPRPQPGHNRARMGVPRVVSVEPSGRPLHLQVTEAAGDEALLVTACPTGARWCLGSGPSLFGFA